MSVKELIESGKAVLGLEFGSTRIKAVLIDENHKPIASGDHGWENRLDKGIWTYTLEDIREGLQDAYANMTKDVEAKYGAKVTKLGAIGFSAMMHGYMAFDAQGELLVPFRTWRNGITGQAAEELTELFQFNIPQRWSIAHIYQAILNEEPHVKDIAYFTTLAGFIHWKLTGEKVLGVGDAAGMFPINDKTHDYDTEMIQKFNEKIAPKNFGWKLEDILPKVLSAGEVAGKLTEEGAKLLDPTGTLQAGALLAPPEGDAGTGMVATNSVAVRTGNVSAGTSIFGMIVLEKALSKVYTEIDMVTTPDGFPVAMVHANNCTSDLNAWVGLFGEFAKLMGMDVDPGTLYGKLYKHSLEGDADCGGLLSYGYLSGENITGVAEGRPMFVRTPKSKFTLANFMRSHLYTALGALKVGMNILTNEEHVEIDSILGHGGLFKTPGVGQRYMAAALQTPVTVMETAGEGGPWGMALLAAYMLNKEEGETLPQYLSEKVFKDAKGCTIAPTKEEEEGFDAFTELYLAGIPVENAAVAAMKVEE